MVAINRVRKVLTAKDMDKFQCRAPGCDHVNCTELFIHTACHPASGIVQACYNKETKTLTLLCGECGKFVTELALKE